MRPGCCVKAALAASVKIAAAPSARRAIVMIGILSSQLAKRRCALPSGG
jgi:hypothetical protein